MLIEKRFPIDKEREGVTGWSYGGFMTMFAVTQTTRFKAAVAGAGISNWQSYYGENSIDQWMIPFFGATVYDDPPSTRRGPPSTSSSRSRPQRCSSWATATANAPRRRASSSGTRSATRA